MHLVADALTFGYPGRPVLNAVGLSASAGDRVGVVGENGAGKTTLLRLLAGDLVPTSGEVRRAGTVSVVPQQLDVEPGTTVGDLVRRTAGHVRAAAEHLDEVVAGFDHDAGDLTALAEAIAAAEHLAAWDVDRRVDEALTRFGAPRDPDRRLDTLSVGEAYRARLACHVAERADVLLLDEPTNHLDAAGIDYLTAQLQDWPGVVVIVTHDRRLLDDVMTAILDLDPSMDGRPVLYGATRYATYRFAKDQALRRWRARYAQERKRAEKLARRLDESYEGLSDEWRPAKGSQKHRRATRARIHVKAADRLVQKLEAEAVEVPVPPPALAFPDLPSIPTGYTGGPLLEVRAPRVAGRLDLAGVRVDLPPAGRLLVTGANGAGKSTLLAAMTGRLDLDRGHRAVAHGVRLGVLTQDDDSPERRRMTGFEAAARRALDLLEAGALDPAHVLPVAALGLVEETDLDRPLGELSVGQRRRFELAAALVAAPHVLVLDEPTNHLSIALVDALTEALRLTSAAVVVATHDRAMRADLADWPTLDL
ncbi:ABC-F family ATP-binding cassette domain-containing protein [Cellulomonas triticagri]|uniref:ABC transporter ATP-binding protein n=1 Tax=Cellulomonas triticagri TaxID=2483352 RepID=A0A3M2JU23_9CELL|nr:ATP-binding cassette domain-containing protein [Cellulomonas triticagri]RMI14255.1 ABC transporter ATP-binding protein [Cellulomonas triticagri]